MTDNSANSDSAAVHSTLAKTFTRQLHSIARWWLDHSQDRTYGGFYGEVDKHNIARTAAEKGVVLNARILWFFSEAALYTQNADYQTAAKRAYHYIRDYFFDRQYGGFYWSLSHSGEVLQDKKQVYAQAFVIYALAAYYQLSKNTESLKMALDCFDLIEANCIDKQNHGYYEAYTRQWGAIKDVRLSEKDLNFPKTMNTHLHLLEAYTKLYQVHKEAKIAHALGYNIDIFDSYIIDQQSYHLGAFFSDNWQNHSQGFTYGHDIESSWLLYQALVTLGDAERRKRLTPVVLGIANTCLQQALGERGEVKDSWQPDSEAHNTARVWWVQAESLVGFLTAYHLSADKRFLMATENLWQFINTYQIDHENGEWHWHSTLDAPDKTRDYKAGFWKGPYHNGRAMLEAAKLLSSC